MEPTPPAEASLGGGKARLRPLPHIDPERCTGCGRCISACGPHVLALERRGWEKVSTLLDARGCTGCRQCAWRCPFDAIEMRPRVGAEA